MKYLRGLSELYPDIASASTQIINLQSILNLPKGTEHFITDIHGEYEAFSHVLKNGSGAVKKKIKDVFGRTLSSAETNTLSTLIYYPKQKMDLIRKTEPDMNDWYRVTLYRLIEVCKRASSKYTRAHVRKMLPPDFAYVIEELITEKAEIQDKEAYYNAIIDTIIDIGRAEPFIIALSELIQKLVVEHLYILGDIYDRGPAADKIMDRLLNYHSVSITWGNHDMIWMGAAAGSPACIATVLRLSIRYSNLDTLEEGYGINLLPLATFATEVYGDDPCELFGKIRADGFSGAEDVLNRKMHKAIAVLQFKLEGQIIKRRGFGMEGRLLLDFIDYKKGTITLDGKTYPLKDTNFPTIDPNDPYRLTEEEEHVMDRLRSAFIHCEKLQEHVKLLLTRGSLYITSNYNLLYHGCVPMTEDGNFMRVNIYGREYAGKALYEELEKYVRLAFVGEKEEKLRGEDIMWYIWCGPKSPLFGKDRMTTFERYFIEDKETHKEHKNAYYRLLNDETAMNRILKEFGLDENAHILNGHVPVLQIDGESPIKCGGKVLLIDGGFSKAYQGKTGIAGYTLIYNSYGMQLVAMHPFTSTEEAIINETDIEQDQIMVMSAPRRLHVADTDRGRRIQERIGELRELLKAYRTGTIQESE
ncbi:MAG: fructose-1,6-bisphosphatase [Lachnospiraceae bacterium]|nr:fructose-1,6-bisphosphatase [Lachnospiraceae bacterium]MCI1329326.1 fructose-1,6-bisphosphatase [Lachnospiraceae bacterium]